MGSVLRRSILAGISLVCLPCVGCLYVPYCLPEINSVGEVRVPWPSDDVHVFRVESTANSWQRTALMIGDGPGGGCDESHELARLQPSERKTIAPQRTVGLEHGWVCTGLVNRVSSSTKHTVTLRFYRRGYETITVKPGDEEKELEWKAALGLAGQEKAVDDLIDTRERAHSLLGYNGNTTAAPGTNSPTHREALHFCVAEYDRIAWLVTSKEPDADGMRSRLKQKSDRLKELAGVASATR